MTSFDVIVPCYKYGHLLAECVSSVLQQERVSVRVLVIDDASPDDTVVVARRLCDSDRRVEYRRHTSNIGHIRTYNEGIDWSRADYLILLSADDYLLPGALARAADALAAHRNATLAFGGCMERWPSGRVRPIRPPAPLAHATEPVVLTNVQFREISSCNNIVPTPTAIVRTEHQKRVGGYREVFPHTGDMEMWLRVSDGHECIYLPQAQAVYRRHANNMSNGFDADFRLPDIVERRRMLQRFYRDSGRAGEPVYRRAMRELADQALNGAILAFEDGRSELIRPFAALASSMNPGWRLTRTGIALSARLVLGRRSWPLLRRALPGASRASLRS